MRALSCLLLSTLALLVSGCRDIADTLFIVEAENEEICKTLRGVGFPGAPNGTSTLNYTFPFPLGQLGSELPEGRLESALSLKLFEITVTEGNADLSTIEYAKISLRRQGTDEIIRTLLEYNRPAEVYSTTKLTVQGIDTVDVPGLARDEAVDLVFEARGGLPPQGWKADLKACAGIWARVHYFDFIF
jgi:hypothetical protein